jgi:phenylalanyl-tRNA synthetase beta chain
MKILYSQIKELVPNLKTKPKEVVNLLTSIGFMADSFEEVKYQNKKDELIGLEIRQNRPDCLSVIGLAKEIAAYYGLKVKLPQINLLNYPKKKLKIKVKAKDFVKRILAVEINGLKNFKSPEWLKKFLSFYDINSINLPVDLSNYTMIFSGYPSHLFDLNKIKGELSWSINNNFKEITTLDGSVLKLNKKNELIVNDDKNILALAGIIGGKTAEINSATESIILEMAVYDSSIVRKNSKDLKITTEASQRLGKNLSPDGLDFTMNFLISIIIKNCQGKINSQIFDYPSKVKGQEKMNLFAHYPKKNISQQIEFDPKAPSIYAGIEIPEKKSIEILKNLDFKIKKNGQKWFCLPPTNRTDISLEEDLIEEVIRIFGYHKIPSNELPKFEITDNITPKKIFLIEKIKNILSTLGFDEILSCPLTRKGDNLLINYLNWDIASTQNSVNEDCPDLRQSMAIGLINQFQEYFKKNIEYIKIFEIGKVFGKKGDNYQEYEALGILKHTFSKEKQLPLFKKTIEKLLRLIGLIDISYIESKNKPQIANFYSCWDIFTGKEKIGIIYKLKPQKPNENTYFSEFNLDKISNLLEKIKNKPAVELTQKLIILDANVEIDQNKPIYDFLNKTKKKIRSENLWSMSVVDQFPLKEKIRYTIRVSYKKLSDLEAKKIHLKIFNLQ